MPNKQKTSKGAIIGTRTNGKETMGFGRTAVEVTTEFGRKVAGELRAAVAKKSRFGSLIK